MSRPPKRPSAGRGPGWTGSFPPPSRPRPVDGGLVVRSSRGQIGEHWWSQRFIAVLESFALGSRLTRGKNYARRGQVVSLEIEPAVVRAKVQGSRSKPYSVTVELTPFTELVWAKVEVVLVEQAIISAKLLAGEMPSELEQVFADSGAHLFPQRATDLQLNCSCPDWEIPCKHLAATFYLLAERFDEDPFQILHWRGRSRPQLLARLRELRSDSQTGLVGDNGAHESAAPSVAGALAALGAAVALADLPSADLPGTAGISGADEPSVADLAAFWTPGPVPALPAHSPLPHDMLLRQMPPPEPELGGDDLVNYLRPLYARLCDSPPLPAPDDRR